MRTIIQRVKKASVKVEGEIIGEIRQGLLVLLAVHEDDTEKDIEWMAGKVMNLRIFGDDQQKINKSVQDVGGEILVVSQFTLYGDCKKGNRPSFIKSARPEKAKECYEKFVAKIKETGVKTETGKFQEHMEVELVNDGPTTIIIESQKVESL
ncbi:D-tyrosyl-tRNA(Tyr) deacylase [Candidatus Falkowbacteria bacterium CG10_big_fil_rev_8_21_14_0_10_43_10]|uniref:D-aminoacyl-tRNA deacylase n=1 Tax=Candidatus Falkowbacteria bacterium CG10_big_fil_rev_8_21_14_0_10_43_10 TaxID=1974567 RepID=A0A2H0V2C4_9BACT|nr:MAG: D-tyrosyl-tRNA(Tyr) deacylase [Candidatus Falkowbacteria bacterium CG10_big_fil_rev_8_21_14_0_10_43_10]